MDIQTEIKKNKDLSKSKKDFINANRIKEFGKSAVMNFDKDYEPDALWFFIKTEDKIVALGGLRPITINYLDKDYNLLGICSIISIEKGKGYGKILMKEMIKHIKKTKKSALGFTFKTEFFKKAGLGTKKDFIKRFIYKNPITSKEIVDNDGDGIYYNGKDNFIKNILLAKDIVYISVLHW